MSVDKKIVIIAGPNGFGKTTFAREFLPFVRKGTGVVPGSTSLFRLEVEMVEIANQPLVETLRPPSKACVAFAASRIERLEGMVDADVDTQ